jgi:hypothetical protein
MAAVKSTSSPIFSVLLYSVKEVFDGRVRELETRGRYWGGLTVTPCIAELRRLEKEVSKILLEWFNTTESQTEND